MSVIVFDVFGTLVSYSGRRINPYRRLVNETSERLSFLTRDVPIDTFAEELGLAHLIPIIRREIDEELRTLQLFEDVDVTLRRLRGAGKRIAVCSNLAAEYGDQVRRMLPPLDAFIYSYEVGAAKPDPAIYEAVCNRLGCRPRDVLFIGDSKRADHDGPREFGMQARLIDRNAGQTLLDVVEPLP